MMNGTDQTVMEMHAETTRSRRMNSGLLGSAVGNKLDSLINFLVSGLSIKTLNKYTKPLSKRGSLKTENISFLFLRESLRDSFNMPATSFRTSENENRPIGC
ncbi:unnamed protein product [Microthlaspi erraticum]|uniref:Uncharacterized protein n=1 Tax=Microthlaspi erraticum TaxID=1685480 RepID=A0A6D2IAP0_9BRAS|nr:unnamed protein product [Microthlaspi erraticum]